MLNASSGCAFSQGSFLHPLTPIVGNFNSKYYDKVCGVMGVYNQKEIGSVAHVEEVTPKIL